MVASGVRLEDRKGGGRYYYSFTLSGGQWGVEPSLTLNLMFFPTATRFGAPPGQGSAVRLFTPPSAPCTVLYYVCTTYSCITMTLKLPFVSFLFLFKKKKKLMGKTDPKKPRGAIIWSIQLKVSHPWCSRIVGCISDSTLSFDPRNSPSTAGEGHRLLSCCWWCINPSFLGSRTATHPHFLESSLAVKGGHGLCKLFSDLRL